MGKIYIIPSRRSSKLWPLRFCGAFLFIVGFAVGLFYGGGGNTLSPALLWQAQFFCGDLTSLPVVVASLPQADEWEGDKTLKHWDVSHYDDIVTGAEIPVFINTVASEEGETTTTADLIKAPQESLALTAVKGDTPQVLIYSTHTSEGYSDGGTVVDVAHALQKNLQDEYGIMTVVSDKVHDSPEWYKSYANSRETAAQLLADYPEAKLIIDLHRDSGVTKAASTLEVDGENMAKLLLVVGSNLTMEHPNWEANLATAERVGACITEVNSEILKGVRVQQGRYNQHLTDKAILLEVGTDLNTQAEAEAATKVVAEAINNYLSTGL